MKSFQVLDLFFLDQGVGKESWANTDVKQSWANTDVKVWLVDLEKLETISLNRVAEELKVKLKDENTKNCKEIREWDVIWLYKLLLL